MAFLRTFDWGGMLLLAGAASSLVFYSSSRAITGIAPLQDGRLIAAALLFLLFFLWWEKRRHDPFIAPSLFTNGPFLRGTFCATMRMVSMGGIGFLIPLYLVDIKGIQPAELGGMLMIGAGSMAVVVRLQSPGRPMEQSWFVVVGLLGQTGTLFAFADMPAGVSLWHVGIINTRPVGWTQARHAAQGRHGARGTDGDRDHPAGLYSVARRGHGTASAASC